MDNDGINRSAVLLMSLGEDEAAEVFKYLAPREVQKIGRAMARLKGVSREDVDGVLGRFRAEAGDQSTVGMEAREYLKTVLVKALGDKSAVIIERILQGGDTSGIEKLKWLDSSTIAQLVAGEHPQIIATILVHLDQDQASEILSHLNERLRTDVVMRVATLDGIQPAALKELNDTLSEVLSGADGLQKSSLGGVRAAAEILNYLPSAQSNQIMESMRDANAELTQQILDEMFVFEDLVSLDDRGIQTLLREVQSESLIVALKGSSQELRDKIFKNMSSRAAEMLREDLDAKGPVKLSDVEKEQKDILTIVRRLADEGQVALSGKGDDAYV
ncbi:MAG: flagellar motor switch protein FliG [Betaproteobacteria bacterium]|nr:MAG: flagellar motor switch protein FliG [Betaproteobacteria bacterium]